MGKISIYITLLFITVVAVCVVCVQKLEPKDDNKNIPPKQSKTFDQPWKSQKPKFRLQGKARQADSHDKWQAEEEEEKVKIKERADKYYALQEQAKQKLKEENAKSKT